MHLNNKEIMFVSSYDESLKGECTECVSMELGTFFDSVMSTVVDFFEEAKID